MKIIRLMCTGRIDLGFIVRAFLNGTDGVFIGGCRPGECHYLTEGNYLALGIVLLSKKLLGHIGVNPERLRLEWVSAAEGTRFAEVVNDFTKKLKELGPLGKGEGLDEKGLKFNLEALQALVPYMKLVERERLRVPFKSESEYHQFFNSEEFDRLFHELILDKLAMSRIMALLRQGPVSIGEISRITGLSPSNVSRILYLLARQGLGRFDERQNLVAAAYEEGAAPEDGERIRGVRSDALDNERVDRILAEHQGKPSSLIHVLMEIQSELHWLPKELLDRISRKLDVPLSRVMQIASFYKTFRLTPKGRHEVHVCTGASCQVRGASHLLDTVHDLLGIATEETDGDSKFTLMKGNCLGCCTLGPEIIIDGKHHPRVTPDRVEAVLKSCE